MKLLYEIIKPLPVRAVFEKSETAAIDFYQIIILVRETRLLECLSYFRRSRVYHNRVHGTTGPSSASAIGMMSGTSTNRSSFASGSLQNNAGSPAAVLLNV